jgi:ribosomal protein S18 acetylase RimI-like enzyme
VSGALSVRAASRADAGAIAAMNRAMALETEGRALDPAALERGVAGVFDDPARGRYFVAVRGGNAVGCLLLTREWSDWRAGHFWWIQSVYVLPAERARGTFRALWDHVRAAARADPNVVGLRLYVEAGNARAQAVYEHLGMQRTGYRLYELEQRGARGISPGVRSSP